MKPWLKAFFAGWIAESAIKSLFQDMQGKEDYLKMIEYGWLSAWYTVPLALVLLLYGFILMKEARIETEEALRECKHEKVVVAAHGYVCTACGKFLQ